MIGVQICITYFETLAIHVRFNHAKLKDQCDKFWPNISVLKLSYDIVKHYFSLATKVIYIICMLDCTKIIVLDHPDHFLKFALKNSFLQKSGIGHICTAQWASTGSYFLKSKIAK